jgi:Ca2+/H+ antiporter
MSAESPSVGDPVVAVTLVIEICKRGDMYRNRIGVVRGTIAVIINILVVVGLLIVLGLLFHKTQTGPGSASVTLTGTSAVIWLVLALAYLIIPKVTTGQTIGRRLVGGRTSKVDGQPAGLRGDGHDWR